MIVAQGALRRIIKTATTNARNASTVGFVGLGNMGSGMAANLISKGHQVIVYDVSAETMSSLEKLGAKKASSPLEVGEVSSKVVTMLPAGSHVEEVLTGNDGVLRGAKAGTLIIDSSTVDPDVSVRMAAAAAKQNISFVDAPVSGGINAAKAGALTFMVGGREEAVASAEELLLCMGKTVIHCGPVGSGGAAKICNNMMLAISMIGYSESMTLGIKLGLDPKVLNAVMNSSSGKTWVSDVYSPVPNLMPNVPSSNNYQFGFGSALMLKDLNLAQTAATRTRAPTPLGGLAQQFYRLLCVKGHSNKDFGYIYQMLADEETR